MERIYFTIAGTFFYHGKDFLEKDMKVKLVKEPDNEYDKIDDTAEGTVLYNVESGVLCYVS